MSLGFRALGVEFAGLGFKVEGCSQAQDRAWYAVTCRQGSGAFALELQKRWWLSPEFGDQNKDSIDSCLLHLPAFLNFDRVI